MTASKLSIKLLSKEDIPEILPIILQLNTEYKEVLMQVYLNEMFEYKTYTCFGLFLENKLIGVTSGWTSTKLYSGKQLEVDNVVIDSKYRSSGYGKFFEEEIGNWCVERNYKSIELNSYVRNARSHKFYFNQGYEIIGYHFEKEL